jgi:purine-binding chemotaxis protein CheW
MFGEPRCRGRSRDFVNSSPASPARERAPSEEDASRAILDERARHLAEPLAEEPLASEFVEVLSFVLGGERFALETRFVREVVRAREPSRLAHRGDALVGVANLRGSVLAVMDPRGAVGVRGGAGELDWLVVVGRDAPEFGLAVDAVREVHSLRTKSLHEPAAGARMGPTALFRGVTADGLVVLDGDALLASELFTIEDAET